MQAKKKKCDGCEELKFVWKNVTEEGVRKRYCRWCWSAHENNSAKRKPTTDTGKSKPIAHRSSHRSKEEAQYNKRAKEWKTDHPYCEIPIPGICTHKTHDVHHMKGREGELLLNEKYWKAACRPCHEWTTVHTQEAIDLGYSLPRTDGKESTANS